MENLPKKSGIEPVEDNPELNNQGKEENKAEAAEENPPKVSREHDFTHTHPTHAHHKTFGLDHEPGAF